jgi:hypothetical protein
MSVSNGMSIALQIRAGWTCPELQSIVFVVEGGVGNEVGEKCYCGSTSLAPVAVLILLKTKQTFFRSEAS